MIRGFHIVFTTFVTRVLVCMRGGQAFVVSCGRRCSGTISNKNNRLPSDPSLQPLLCRDWVTARSDHVCSNAGRHAIARRFRTSIPADQRRINRRGRSAVMASSSTSHFSTAGATDGLPVKQHRNTFLLPPPPPRRPRDGRQSGDTDPAQSTPSMTQPQEGRRLVDNSASSGGKAGGDLEPAADSDGGGDEDGPLALVILNVRGEGESMELLHHLWDRAALRLCADGGANRLHDSFGDGADSSGGGDPSEERARFVPDVIVGDLDSLRPEVARYYEALGCEIALRADQDHCDFEKCLMEVESRLPSAAAEAATRLAAATAASADDGGEGSESREATTTTTTARTTCPATVVGLGAFGGRFDHEMQAFSLLHTYTSRFDRLVLMGAGNVAFLLEPGLSHAVQPDLRFEGPTVGLIPIGGPCRKIRTEGLQWNLEDQGMEFGVLVSSSNCVVEDVVRVVTDAPLVWTAEFKAASWIDALGPMRGVRLGVTTAGVQDSV
ncbi:unnamed protein product [Scytosiphon promiscuus]